MEDEEEDVRDRVLVAVEVLVALEDEVVVVAEVREDVAVEDSEGESVIVAEAEAVPLDVIVIDVVLVPV